MPALLYAHIPKNLLLILLSLVFLPLDTTILFFAYLLRPLIPQPHRKNNASTTTASPPGQTILITGVSMTKALALTRLLRAHSPHHRIIGADFHSLASGRASRSLTSFRVLTPPTSGDTSPYIASLLSLIATERVALWISCSAVASAVEDGVAAEVVAARTPCRVVQFGVADVRELHAKDAFMARTRRLGLRVPETRTVRSREEMVAELRRCAGLSDRGGKGPARKFIVKSVGVDDRSRGDLTLLPRATERETRAHVAALDVGPERPWIVQEFVRGREYCTHALVVAGRVRAFVACPSAELLMHYRALPVGSPLARAMLAFTERQAAEGGEGFTGHLSFDFLVKDEDVGKKIPESIALFPIECNPRAHTADILFNGTVELADEYLSVLQISDSSVNGSDTNGAGINGAGTNGAGSNGEKRKDIVVPKQQAKYYWIGHDLVQLFLLPLLSLLSGQASIGNTWMSVRDFVEHVLFWKDGTFELWDPLPWWWLYHVYWPVQFVNSIRTGRKWSRINVSTTKMFDSD